MNKMAFVVLALFCAQASALTPKEAKKFKDWQDELKNPETSYSKAVKEKCGYEIPVTMEDKFVTPFMTENASAASYCDSARSAISGLCGDDTYKGFVKKNIKKIDCKLGKKEEASFKLAGGTLTFTVGVGAANLEDKAKEYLENNMK